MSDEPTRHLLETIHIGNDETTSIEALCGEWATEDKGGSVTCVTTPKKVTCVECLDLLKTLEKAA